MYLINLYFVCSLSVQLSSPIVCFVKAHKTVQDIVYAKDPVLPPLNLRKVILHLMFLDYEEYIGNSHDDQAHPRIYAYRSDAEDERAAVAVINSLERVRLHPL